MLSMAKGIKVGSGVWVLRGKCSTQKGVMQTSEGVGRARKWIVKLNGGVWERFSARTLELEQRHLIPPPSTFIKAVSFRELSTYVVGYYRPSASAPNQHKVNDFMDVWDIKLLQML